MECPYALVLTKCTLTGKACLCCDNQLNCTRRAFAIQYEANQVKTPRNVPPVVLTDGTGHVQDIV